MPATIDELYSKLGKFGVDVTALRRGDPLSLSQLEDFCKRIELLIEKAWTVSDKATETKKAEDVPGLEKIST
jgi:hypothetical protein